ncbi:MAG: sirohydrochlorin chelatase [Methylocystaceae bacterium]|nr:sirohydrochlorin chelatase [Methylocystaceae bacterium]
MQKKIGVMICGHGSRSQDAVDQFSRFVGKLPPYLPDWPIEYGYLEFANPVIRDGLDRLRGLGCNHILAVPGMLFAAMHAKNDIPSVLNAYAKEHGIEIGYGRDLGVDENMITASAARVEEALKEADENGPQVSREDTCLVVIGRGSSDPDANGNVAKITRMIKDQVQVGWAETGYSGVTFPLVQPCLEKVVKLGYKRIIVFPYFLFSGVLIDRIYGFTDLVASQHKDIQFVKADYLNDHPMVLTTMANRVKGILTGDNAMDCSMCKYRAQILGFESEIGLPQLSHHHHVEGQGAQAPGSNVSDCKLCDTFCTGVCRLLQEEHDHGDHSHHHHHHPVYPHADHPMGPESARHFIKK